MSQPKYRHGSGRLQSGHELRVDNSCPSSRPVDWKEQTHALSGAGLSGCGIDRRSAEVYADVARQTTGAGFVVSAFSLFSGNVSEAISKQGVEMESRVSWKSGERIEIGRRRTKTASKPVKLQRPDKGRRVQSLLNRTCSPAPCDAKNKPRRVLGNRQNYLAHAKTRTGTAGMCVVRITLR